MLSHVWLFATPWTVALQALLSMGFFRQEYWSRLPFPPPRDLPDPEAEPASSVSPALQADSLLLSHQGNTWSLYIISNSTDSIIFPPKWELSPQTEQRRVSVYLDFPFFFFEVNIYSISKFSILHLLPFLFPSYNSGTDLNYLLTDPLKQFSPKAPHIQSVSLFFTYTNKWISLKCSSILFGSSFKLYHCKWT